MAEKCGNTKKSKVIPGEWHAELLGAGSVHLGGATNLSASSHAIEFSWVTLPAAAHGPNKIVLAAVVVLMVPAEVVSHEHPGSIMQNGLMTMSDLFVTRIRHRRG
jgi:xanthine/uracil permease